MKKMTRIAWSVAVALLAWPLSAGVPATSQSAMAQDAPPQIIETSRWRAWIDAMPGPGKRAHPLYVTGEVVLATPGYKTTLVKANPRDTRAPVLVLDLVITRERKPDGQVVTSYAPRYSDEAPPRRYSGVQVRYNGRVLATIERIDTIR